MDTSSDSSESTDEMDTSQDLVFRNCRADRLFFTERYGERESEDQSSQAKIQETGKYRRYDTDSSVCDPVCGSGSCSRRGGIS